MLAQALYDRFGSAIAASKEIDYPNSTIYNWKWKGFVPYIAARRISEKFGIPFISIEEAKKYSDRPHEHPYAKRMNIAREIHDILAEHYKKQAANA